MSALTIMKVTLIATIAIGVSGSLLAWRERPEPGSIPLAALLAGQSWWSATLFFKITATDIGEKIFWVDISWVGVVVIPVAWVLFSLEYTGYSQYVRPRYILLISIVPAVTAILGVTDNYHGLMYTSSTLVEHSGVLTLERVPGIWFWVITGYTYLLGLVGAIPLLRFLTSDVERFRGQSLAILVGLIVPWVTSGLFVFDLLPTAGIDPTPVAFSISGVAYLTALKYFELLGTIPAPIRKARQTVYRRMQEGAIVLDRHDHVVDMNDQAIRALDIDPADVLGRKLERTIPNLEEALSTRSQKHFSPEHSRGDYDISTSEITDARGRTIGRIVTLHDISDYLRQQQRLEVLNRVFRHNIRTNTQVIIGNVEYIADNSNEAEAEMVLENALEIEEISDKIRMVLDLFEQKREPAQPAHLSALLDECVESVRDDYPAVEIDCDLESGDVYIDSVLQTVLSNLVENAAQHNTSPDPWVRVDVESDGEHARIVVEDNGPGIDEEELALIERGTETPLKHGSGFGLALIVWGTDITGGTVSFEENEPTGLTVTIEAPVLSRSERDDPSRRGPGAAQKMLDR